MESGGEEAVSVEDLEDPEVEALVGDEYGVAASRIHAHYPPVTSSRDLMEQEWWPTNRALAKELD